MTEAATSPPGKDRSVFAGDAVVLHWPTSHGRAHDRRHGRAHWAVSSSDGGCVGCEPPIGDGTARAYVQIMLDQNDDVPILAEQPAAQPHVNSVDATMGQPMIARVMARKLELETLLEALPAESLRARSDIDLALNTINELLTGDLTALPSVVVADMSHWLEHNKHLAEQAR